MLFLITRAIYFVPAYHYPSWSLNFASIYLHALASILPRVSYPISLSLKACPTVCIHLTHSYIRNIDSALLLGWSDEGGPKFPIFEALTALDLWEAAVSVY